MTSHTVDDMSIATLYIFNSIVKKIFSENFKITFKIRNKKF